MNRRTAVIQGYSLGSVLAAIASWIVNKSVLWVFLHFFCGWIYLAWACVVHTTVLNRAVADTLRAK